MAAISLKRLLDTSQLDWQWLHGHTPSRVYLSPACPATDYRLSCPAPHLLTLEQSGHRTSTLAMHCGVQESAPVTAQSVVYTRTDIHSARCALALALAEHAGVTATQCHATLIRMHGLGILISGTPGSGKSTLALTLIREADAALVADDCVDVRALPGGAVGSCPALLRNYLHIPELGALDIARVFGQTRSVTACQIDLGIHLTAPEQATPAIKLHGNWRRQILAGVELTTLDLVPRHVQAVALVDIAARMVARTRRPQTMSDALQQRQQQAIKDGRA